MRSIIVSCLAAVTAMASIPRAQEPLTLKLNLQPGASYIYTMDMNQSNTQTVDGEEQKLEQQMLMVWDYNVLERKADGNMVVEIIYHRVKISQNYGHESTGYDSDNPPDYLDPSMKGMASLPGSELTIGLRSNGDVLEIRGVEELLDKMIAALELPESPQRDAVIQNLRAQFGVDAIKQSIEQITSFYPDKPVNVGDRWKNNVEVNTGFPMRIDSEYNLKLRQDGAAMIDVASQLSSNPQKAMSVGPLTMAYDIAGTQTGSIIVDETTGLPTKSEISLQFSGTVKVSGVPNEEPQSWPISVLGNVDVTFEKRTE